MTRAKKNPQSGVIGVDHRFFMIHNNGVCEEFLADDDKEFVTILLGQRMKGSGGPNAAELIHILHTLGFYPRAAIDEKLGASAVKHLDEYIKSKIFPQPTQ